RGAEPRGQLGEARHGGGGALNRAASSAKLVTAAAWR
ncbi:MAG: hypothetical protein QOC94_4506, partial [Actinoplanes sp.]|nr:hypothetical protein [Actinoplanes sp.]